MKAITIVFNTLMALIWLTTLEIVNVGCLWVLRIVIDWWLDIDYVEKLKEFIKDVNDRNGKK